MNEIDQVMLNFTPSSLFLLNIILGIVMFGIALDLTLDDFRRIFSVPRAAFIGLVCQFVLLPAATFLLVLIWEPLPSMALGMFLVAACPGGNMSNFFCHFARGNTALSVTMTAISTVAAIVMTPLNFAFWGGLYEPAQPLLQTVAVNPVDMFVTILFLIGLPLALGILVNSRLPQVAEKLRTPFKYFSLGIFALFILLAFIGNWSFFLQFIGLVAVAVFIHNGIALLLGYSGARAIGLPEADRRAVSIEVGIQNSGLGLLLIFSFFDGLGGMAIIAAWWGVWHLISGLTLASIWSRREPRTEKSGFLSG